MSRRTSLLLATFGLASLLLVGGAVARSEKPTVTSPLPFDHGVHQLELERLGLRCIDCHGFEAPPKPDESSRPLLEVPAPPPAAGATPPVRLALCHGCHQTEDRTSPSAPRACAACHPVRAELQPVSHGMDWGEAHGREARRPRADCTDCHERDTCVACHDSRGALAPDSHPPGFRALHGLEARLDPASCDTCHTGESCMSCHSSGGIPW